MKTLIQLFIALTLISFCNAQTNEIDNLKNKSGKTLPEGVTKEWLNSLQDENGKRIVTQQQDSGDAFQTRNFSGYNAGDNYGQSVASAGDVNGDGYNDIIIGAPYNNGAASGAGRAYIYFGGLNVNTIPDVTLSGDAANLYFGISVSAAGDVNGDGYADVIAGEYGYYNFTGRALIFFGGAHMNNLQDVVITGENISDILGNSVSAAGDVNGDGYSDVIIGAYNYGGIGRAYICFGGSNMDGAPDLFLTGEASGDSFGTAVSGAGDVNNDGYSDVLVTANAYNGYTGKAYLYFGGSNMNNTVDITFNGQNAGDNFGVSAAYAGDINGDSYSDIIIGAVGFSGNTGSAYIYFGGSNMNNTADVTLYGENSFNYFGNSVSGAGDINGDGYSDVIIGAPYSSSSAGKAYIYFGGVNMDNTSDISFSGESVNNYFGTSVASAGDMNGDGFSDVMVGANGNNSYTGKAYLYMEGMTGTYFANLTMNGEAANNSFGSVASAGDVNGDGYSDVIVGATYFNPGFAKAYIFYGGSIMNNIADVILTGDSGVSSFGYSVASAGDLNGDGYSDVIVGNPGYSYTGRAYIFFGGSSMNNTVDVVMTGETTNDQFGHSVNTAGDVNGDGYSDVIIGANGNGGNRGKVYIYFGGASMNNVVDLSMSGETIGSLFGYSVSTAGDVNGDGYSDVIVGAYNYNNNTGRAYIYDGGATMDTYTDVIMTGENTSSNFGISVSSAGDVNGDGYSDVIIGAAYIGKAYIYIGGPAMDNYADVILKVDGLNANFGYSVSSAGDLNGDGYSDVIVGAIENTTAIGKAFAYYGSPVMNNVPDISLSGEGINNYFGNSVSSAGDLNGDGYPDIIVGAPGYNSNTGRTYIYYSSSPSVNPNIVSIKDVPFDQGGYVKLKWVKSGNDVPVTGTITSYLIERSVPPGAGGYQWEQIGTVLPTQNNLYYYYTTSTPADSGINGNSTFFFRVTAYTSASTVLYRSNIISGHSIDNLAPNAVQSFSANPLSGNIRLNWNRNHEADLKNYLIYRSTSPSVNPDSATVFAAVTDSTYLDTAPLSGVYYYFIFAQDIHNNKSPVVSSAGNQSITVSLTSFIEGFYNTSSNVQISDTINVYLRNVNAPYSIVDSCKALLNQNGNAVLNFVNAPNGNYYIVIRHRNALETWSRSGGENLNRGVTFNYDMSDLSSKAFGNNIKQIDNTPARFGLYSGDVTHDGFIDLTDVLFVYNDGKNFMSGYINTDVTGDNITDLSDILITYNNSAGFVSVMRP
jgi:hypothetical protein